MNQTLARFQAVSFVIWAACWLVGSFLPGALASLFYLIRNLAFLFLSALTLLLGYRLYFKKETILLFYMDAHIRLARMVAGSKAAVDVSRSYRKQSNMHQTGQICLIMGGICLLVGLYYFI